MYPGSGGDNLLFFINAEKACKDTKYKAKLQKMAKNSTEVETNSEDNNNNKQESPSNDDNGSIDKVSKGKSKYLSFILSIKLSL